MAGMAAIASPGEFRIKDTDPEAIAASFDRYIRRMEAFFVVSRSRGQNGALIDIDSDTKKGLLLTVGGDEIIKLYDHVGNVQAGDNYTTTIEKIKTGLRGQTNQSMQRYRLFRQMPQGEESFNVWWKTIKEQSDKCTWEGYNRDSAAKDAIIFQTSSQKLRKKCLAEDLSFEDAVKAGLALENSEKKAAKMTRGEKSEEVRRLEEQVRRLKFGDGKDRASKKSCKTCTKKHDPGRTCPADKRECFTCGETGHFKGASICKGKPEAEQEKKRKKKDKNKKHVRKVQFKTDSSTESDSSEDESQVDTDSSVGRVQMVGRAVSGQTDAKALVKCAGADTEMLVDSGVGRTLVSEKDWKTIKKVGNVSSLKRAKVNFRPYGTNISLPMKGRAKVELEAVNGKKHNTVIYVVKGDVETLLGKEDAMALGIIQINSEGDFEEKQEKIARLQKVEKDGSCEGSSAPCSLSTPTRLGHTGC